jgi:hypothetical protein
MRIYGHRTFQRTRNLCPALRSLGNRKNFRKFPTVLFHIWLGYPFKQSVQPVKAEASVLKSVSKITGVTTVNRSKNYHSTASTRHSVDSKT